LLGHSFRLHIFDEITSFQPWNQVCLDFNHIHVNEEIAVSCTIDKISHVLILGCEVFQKGSEGGDAGAAGEEHDVRPLLNHEIPVGQLYPYPAAFLKFIFHASGVTSLDGIGDSQIIPLGRGTGDGEDTGFGPETAGVVVVEGQVEKLAGPEAGHWALRGEINGIDMIAVSGDLLDLAADFLGSGHRVYFVGLSVTKEFIKYFLYIFHFDLIDSGINADEECVVHDEVRVRQVPGEAMGDVLIGRVAQEVAAEEVARFDAVGFQIRGDVVAGEPGAFPDGDHVTEPGGIGILRGPGQDEAVGVRFQDLGKFEEILLAPGDEAREFL